MGGMAHSRVLLVAGSTDGTVRFQFFESERKWRDPARDIAVPFDCDVGSLLTAGYPPILDLRRAMYTQGLHCSAIEFHPRDPLQLATAGGTISGDVCPLFPLSVEADATRGESSSFSCYLCRPRLCGLQH